MLNFVVIRDIHFIIVFLLNDIIDILFHLSNTYVLYLSGIVRSNAGEWWREKKLIWWTSYSYFGLPFCNESLPKIQDSNIKLNSQTHFYSFPQPLFFSSIASIWSDDSRKVKNASIGQVEEDINDVIEEENDDKVNVADDNEIKHEASLT